MEKGGNDRNREPGIERPERPKHGRGRERVLMKIVERQSLKRRIEKRNRRRKARRVEIARSRNYCIDRRMKVHRLLAEIAKSVTGECHNHAAAPARYRIGEK